MDFQPHQVLGLRYTSAVGIACLLYDHVLTFESERRFIWANPNVTHLSKFGFFTNRYGSAILGIYLSIMLSATRDLDVPSVIPFNQWRFLTKRTIRCKNFVWIFSILAPVFVTLSHYAVVLRIYRSWDRRRAATFILPISFLFALAGISTLGGSAAAHLGPRIRYVPRLRSCLFQGKPATFPAMLGIVSLYDLFLILLTIYNALDMPRQRDIEIVRSLQNDSAVAFLLLFLLRFVNFLLAVISDGSDAFLLLPLVWLFCAVINARLHIRLEGIMISTATSDIPPLKTDSESNVRSALALLPVTTSSTELERRSVWLE